MSALFVAFVFAFSGCETAPMAPSAQPYSVPQPTTARLPTPYSQPKTLYHEVGPAETLWRISKMYDVDMQTLMRTNKISDPTQIRNGQRLVIPNTMGPVPVIPLYPTRRWTHIVIHHTATDSGNARSIDVLHHKRGFWNGLGYHFLVDNGTNGKFDGQIEVGPRWIKQKDGAHANASGMNEKGIGISIVGNYSEGRLSEASLQSLLYLVQTLQNYYGIPDHQVIRHGDVPGKATECPGLRFPWNEFRRRLSQR